MCNANHFASTMSVDPTTAALILRRRLLDFGIDLKISRTRSSPTFCGHPRRGGRHNGWRNNVDGTHSVGFHWFSAIDKAESARKTLALVWRTSARSPHGWIPVNRQRTSLLDPKSTAPELYALSHRHLTFRSPALHSVSFCGRYSPFRSLCWSASSAKYRAR